MRTLDGVDVLSGMFSEQSLVGEDLVAVCAGERLVWGSAGLAVEMVLQFSVVGEMCATVGTSHHLLLQMTPAVL